MEMPGVGEAATIDESFDFLIGKSFSQTLTIEQAVTTIVSAALQL